jgi:hypothetical protein
MKNINQNHKPLARCQVNTKEKSFVVLSNQEPPTAAELEVLKRFRASQAEKYQKLMSEMDATFGGQAEVFGRLKEAERIHEAFFRKGWDFGSIDDIAGMTVKVDTLEQSVDAIRKLQRKLDSQGYRIVDPESGTLTEADIQDLLAKDKRRFRTTGYVVEVDDVLVEIGVQTRSQRRWTELTHDTPVYKPNLFQAEWGMTDPQVQALTDYAFESSKYLHYIELRGMHKSGSYTGPLKSVARPAAPARGAVGGAKPTQLVKDLEDTMNEAERLAPR